MTVLIVGAGPTGLMLACDLARRGVSCRVIDKAQRLCTVRKAMGVGFEGDTFDTERTLIGDIQVDGLDGVCCHMFTKAGDITKRFSLWEPTRQPALPVRGVQRAGPTTTWAGSSLPCSQARRKSCWTATRRSGCRRSTSSTSATATVRWLSTTGPSQGSCAPATARLAERSTTAGACSTYSGDRTSPCWRLAAPPVVSP